MTGSVGEGLRARAGVGGGGGDDRGSFQELYGKFYPRGRDGGWLDTQATREVAENLETFSQTAVGQSFAHRAETGLGSGWRSGVGGPGGGGGGSGLMPASRGAVPASAWGGAGQEVDPPLRDRGADRVCSVLRNSARPASPTASVLALVPVVV